MTALNPHFFGGEIYRRTGFGNNHPLAIPRVGLVLEICETLGWLDENYSESPRASVTELSRYHAPEYIEAVRLATESGAIGTEDRERYNLGNRENPIFDGLFERATSSCGGSIAAAKHALSGGIGFNPAGGTHHGMPNKAHGFCYFNDPVMAILTLLEGGAAPVLYVDLDAHHGDGVEHAFKDEPQVATISIHEANRWPNTGVDHGPVGSNVYNFAVPRGFNDAELAFLIDNAVMRIVDTLQPKAVVITCGADGLDGDPLSSMSLSNVGLWNAVTKLTDAVPMAVVLGGGGYNPWTVARCWSGLWGVLNGFQMPVQLPAQIEKRFRVLDCDLIDEEDWEENWFHTLVDKADLGQVRAEITAMAKEIPGISGKDI